MISIAQKLAVGVNPFASTVQVADCFVKHRRFEAVRCAEVLYILERRKCSSQPAKQKALKILALKPRCLLNPDFQIAAIEWVTFYVALLNSQVL